MTDLTADVLYLRPEAGNLPDRVRDLPRGEALHHVVQLVEALLQVGLEVGAAALQVLPAADDLVVQLHIGHVDRLLELRDVVVDLLRVGPAVLLHGGATVRNLLVEVGLRGCDEILDVFVLLAHIGRELLVLVVQSLDLLLEYSIVGVDFLRIGFYSRFQSRQGLSML